MRKFGECSGFRLSIFIPRSEDERLSDEPRMFSQMLYADDRVTAHYQWLKEQPKPRWRVRAWREPHCKAFGIPFNNDWNAVRWRVNGIAVEPPRRIS